MTEEDRQPQVPPPGDGEEGFRIIQDASGPPSLPGDEALGRKCPYCVKPIPRLAQKCPHCARPLGRQVVRRATEAEEKADELEKAARAVPGLIKGVIAIIVVNVLLLTVSFTLSLVRSGKLLEMEEKCRREGVVIREDKLEMQKSLLRGVTYGSLFYLVLLILAARSLGRRTSVGWWLALVVTGLLSLLTGLTATNSSSELGSVLLGMCVANALAVILLVACAMKRMETHDHALEQLRRAAQAG